MSLRRASYALHIALSADGDGGQGVAAGLDFVRTLDDLLDHLNREPRAAYGVIQGGAHLLEAYLSLRPEHFEALETAGHAGKLIIAPFYHSPRGETTLTVELLIRNLLLGQQTAKVFARPLETCYLPFMPHPPPYLPQIAHGFGMRTVIMPMPPEGSAEGRWSGDDGSEVILGWTLSGDLIPTLRGNFAGFNRSGEMLITCPWQIGAEAVFSQIGEARRARDDVFSSHPGRYARALETFARQNDLPALTLEPSSAPAQAEIIAAERLITRHIEPASVLAHYQTLGNFLPRPERLIQQLWRWLITASVQPHKPESLVHLRRIHEYAAALQVDSHDLVSTVVGVDPPTFSLTAVKLLEAGSGLMVRGVNTGQTPIWVRIYPFRRFESGLVMRHDETPTGGVMGLDKTGAIRFRAEPGRLLTFGFR